MAQEKSTYNIWPRCNGSVSLMFIFFLNTMLAFLAVTFGAAMGMNVKGAELNAATAASLAGAGTGGNTQKAMDYFQANFRDGDYGIHYVPSDISIVVTNDQIVVTPTDLEMPTFFPINALGGVMSGSYSLNVSAQSIASLPTGTSASANFSFIIDRTGSMRNPTVFNGISMSKANALALSYQGFVQTLAAKPNAANLYTIAGVGYNDDVVVEEMWQHTNDFQATVDKVNFMMDNANFCTGGAYGIKAMREMLTAAPPPSNELHIIVFETDGIMNLPVNPNNPPPCVQQPGQPFTPALHPLGWTATFTSPYWQPYEGAPYELPDPLPTLPPSFNYVNYPFMAAAAECHKIRQAYPSASFWSIGFGPDSQSGVNNELLTFCADPGQFVYAADGTALNATLKKIADQALSSYKLIQ